MYVTYWWKPSKMGRTVHYLPIGTHLGRLDEILNCEAASCHLHTRTARSHPRRCSVRAVVLIRFPARWILSFAAAAAANSQPHHIVATSRSSLVDQIRFPWDIRLRNQIEFGLQEHDADGYRHPPPPGCPQSPIIATLFLNFFLRREVLWGFDSGTTLETKQNYVRNTK